MTRMYNTVPKVKQGESWGNTGPKNKTENHLSPNSAFPCLMSKGTVKIFNSLFL